MPPAKKYPCLICSTEVGGKTGGVQCTYYDRWVHPKCANITKAHLELYKLPSCQYICDTCVKVSAKIKKEIQHLQVTTMEMRENIEANKQELGAQKRRLEKVEKKVEELDPAKIIEQSRDGMLKELRERDTMKDNLVFYQVEEPEMTKGHERKEYDIKKIIKVCEFLQCPLTTEGIKFIFREGEKKDDCPGLRPIIICLKDPGARKYILENTRRLASSQYGKISITPDLTPLQRKEEEELRKEAETRNKNLNDEDRLNYEWVCVGMKGQRTLIKRRKIRRDGDPPRWERGTGMGRVEGNGRSRRGPLPTQEPPRARETVMAEGEKERERVRKLEMERQAQKDREKEKEPEKDVEPEKEKHQSPEPEKDQDQDEPEIIEDTEEPRGIMEMEEEEEDTEDEQETTHQSQIRDPRKRTRGDTSLSPPQISQKKKT